MRRLLVAALLVLGCGSHPPQIDSFTADNPNPLPGAEVHLSWVVRGASSLSIAPAPGQVTSNTVTVRPLEPTTYTLRAANPSGVSSKDVLVNARNRGAASVLEFSVVPSQAPAGTPRTLSWKVANGLRTTLSGGASGSIAIEQVGQAPEAPVQTTTYTLSTTSSVGFVPAQVSARAVARVVAAAAITSFTATPPALLQGEAATLRWDGTALGWSVGASTGGTTNLGVAKSLVVRPAATTTYALTGTGPGGVDGPQQIVVTVTPRPATALAYTPPLVSSEKLVVIADLCAAPPPCTTLTLRVLAAQAVALRGVSINLPLDAAKLSLDPASFGSALDAGKAALGTGPLRDTLVLGAAMKGTGAAPAADRAFAANQELAHFSVALQPQGGQGIVFDGAAAFASFIQSASGRNPGGIAVGRLEAK